MAKPTAYHEEALLQRLKEGDDQAFEELFHHHWDHVYSAAFLFTKSTARAHDIAQDTFLSLWKNRQDLHTIVNLKGFLFTSVKYLVYKQLRRTKVAEAYALYLQRHSSDDSQAVPEQEEFLEYKALQSTLLEGISQLPPQQQLAFRLSREEGLSHEQISHIMGVSKKTVKDYIVRSLAFLRPLLKHYSGLFLALLLQQL